MGYYYHYDENKFFLPVEKVPAAIAALQAWDASMLVQKYDYQAEYDVLDRVASNQGWYAVERDGSGNITGVGFDEIKGHDNHEWLEVLAPFVRRGSYVQIHNDYGRVYRYVFDGKVLKYIEPHWEMQELANW